MMGQAQVGLAAREPIGPMRAVWSGLDAAATPALMIATLAVLVRTLNASDYGILVMALAASGLSMAINPAIAATTTRFVSELSAQPEPGGRTVAAVITVSLMAVSLMDLAMLLAVAAFNAPLSRWIFGAELLRTRHLGHVLLLAVLAVGAQQIEAVLAAAIRGLERFRRQALIELLSRSVLIAVVAGVAWRTRSLEWILIAQFAVYLVSMMVRATALRQILPNKRLFDLSGRAEAGTLLRYGGWMWLTALAGVAYTSADRIIVGQSLGAAAAGQYNIYVQITQLAHFIPSSVFAFLLPAFSRVGAHGPAHKSELARTYKAYRLAIGMMGLAIAAAITLFWPFLLRVVAGSGAEGAQFDVVGLLTLNFLLLTLNVAPYYLLLALGRAKMISMICTASMLAALLLMMILIPRYGLQGAALARLAYGIGALMLLHPAHRALNRE